jgi:acyl carrier protein
MNPDVVLSEVGDIIRTTFRCPGATITRDTTAVDINGWDSLSHTNLMMDVEQRFGMELPVDRMFDLADVGELVDLIVEVKGGV